VTDSDAASAAQLVVLEREECLRLLAESTLGRLAVSPPGWSGPPVLRPVNYAFDPSSRAIVFRSAPGSKFTALLLAGEAAFEIDRVDPGKRSAWSVIAQGFAEEVTRDTEVRRLDALALEPWAPGDKPHWIRIQPTAVSGRRIIL
jgi:nitroimidazol reductase NimA-like FMN-containing flavoprotein (pyridoxamine 5'-phosphate oxidase superfamily)